MKINQRGATLIALIVSGIHAFADVRPVQLSLQCSNVMLSWPSQPGETFTVQYRQTLSTNTPWLTLTNLLRADLDTNVTTFVHSVPIRFVVKVHAAWAAGCAHSPELRLS